MALSPGSGSRMDIDATSRAKVVDQAQDVIGMDSHPIDNILARRDDFLRAVDTSIIDLKKTNEVLLKQNSSPLMFRGSPCTKRSPTSRIDEDATRLK